MKLTLRIWRQQDAKATGRFVTYEVDKVTPEMSFLEMLDVLNESLTEGGEAPVAFEHDCPTGRAATPRCASSTCGSSRTAMP
jgi:succinate dehydrogenase / fumarate reductase iron-sulfur subunit